MIHRRLRRVPAASALCAAAGAIALAAAHALAATPAAPFAKVGDTVITHEQYDAAFSQAARGKFYHGKPPEAEVARLQREVGQQMVDDILLAREARRRGIRPDGAAVGKALAGYDARYQDSAQWQAGREQMLPRLKAKLEHDSIREQLARQVKAAPEPTPAQLRQFYDQHRDKFTSPEQVHLRMILLAVDPSSPQAKWDGAIGEGKALAARLKKGADFGELARMHSADASAAGGGDMGYVHAGMLPDAAQQAVDRLKPGEATGEPVVLLEGVALFQLQDRRPPVLNPLESVRDRCRELYLRDKGEEQWNALLVRLRKDNPVKIDESRFLPLARAGTIPAAR